MPNEPALSSSAYPVVLDELYKKLKINTLSDVSERNGQWFDLEMSKLESWADDLKVGLERELKDLDAEIKLRKAEARQLLKLEEKIKLQRIIKDMEATRSEKRKTLFEAQDEIDARKEGLLKNIEGRLKQHLKEKNLFTIKWSLI